MVGVTITFGFFLAMPASKVFDNAFEFGTHINIVYQKKFSGALGFGAGSKRVCEIEEFDFRKDRSGLVFIKPFVANTAVDKTHYFLDFNAVRLGSPYCGFESGCWFQKPANND